MEPDWFLLMREWVKQNYGDRGITLPFLTGALAYKTNKTHVTRDDASRIVDEMITRPVEGYVTEIIWCSPLKAAVLAATEAPSRFNPQVGFRHPSQNHLRVVFENDLQQRWHSTNPQDLVAELLDESEVAITAGEFSRDAKLDSWRGFEEWEKNFITQTII